MVSDFSTALLCGKVVGAGLQSVDSVKAYLVLEDGRWFAGASFGAAGRATGEIVFHTGPGDKEWEEYAIGNAPAMVVGDLVKFVGLAPSKESLVGALREAGLE